METKNILIGVVVIAVLLAGLWWYQGTGPGTTNGEEQTATYSDQQFGISFEYRQQPDGYVIVPQRAGGDALFALSMFDYAEYQEFRKSGPGREAPAAITLEVIANPNKLSPEQWVRTAVRSNFSLSQSEKISNESVDGKKAVAYDWDGLYRTHSVAVGHRDRIYLFSVGYLNASDQIRKDFYELLVNTRLE